MDRTEAAQLARALMNQHGLVNWSFGFNRAKRSLGLCKYECRRIEMSIYYIAANDDTSIRDTLLHEIAHALADRRAGHGPAWKAICRRIGATPERCDRQAAMPIGCWQATCPTCGQVFSRHRRPGRGRIYSCNACGRTRGQLRFQRSAPHELTPVES